MIDDIEFDLAETVSACNPVLSGRSVSSGFAGYWFLMVLFVVQVYIGFAFLRSSGYISVILHFGIDDISYFGSQTILTKVL